MRASTAAVAVAAVVPAMLTLQTDVGASVHAKPATMMVGMPDERMPYATGIRCSRRKCGWAGSTRPGNWPAEQRVQYLR